MPSFEELGIDRLRSALSFLEREPLRNLRIIWALRRWGLFNLGLPEQGRYLTCGDSGGITGLIFLNNLGLLRWEAGGGNATRLVECAVSAWGEPEALAGPEKDVEAVLKHLDALAGRVEHVEKERSLYLRDGDLRPVPGPARIACEDDLEDLVELEREMQRELLGSRAAGWVIRSQLRRAVEDGVASVVRWKGKAVAKAEMDACTPGANELGGVYTLPRYRRRGLASSACSLICQASLAGGRTVRLETQRENEAALSFYTRLGFRELWPHLFVRIITDDRQSASRKR
ncbi:MAG: GNAT family N-acetyltransferase [Actinomycetota bacterium]|nr:GNAT family N-acetyltransferase [Actinomycetota bacterium]